MFKNLIPQEEKQINVFPSFNSFTDKEPEIDYDYLEISKEKPNLISIPNSLFQKLLTHYRTSQSFLSSLNTHLSTLKQEKLSLIQNFSLKEKNLYEIISAKDKEIKNLKSESDKLKSTITSYLNQFKEQEAEIFNIKKENEKIIKQRDALIKEIKLENEELKLKNTKSCKEMKKKENLNNIEKVFTEEKLLNKIISYLPKKEKEKGEVNYEIYLTLCLMNKKINFYLSNKIKTLFYQKRLDKANQKLNLFYQKDLSFDYNMEETQTQSQISELIKKYTQPHVLPGDLMNLNLFTSLHFIKNKVFLPIKEKYDTLQSNINIFENLFSINNKKFINKIFPNYIENKNNTLNKENKNNSTKKMIALNLNDYLNLSTSELDSLIERYFVNNEKISINFAFSSSEEIKKLFSLFLKEKLDKKYYNGFLQNLIDQFCDLFYNCYQSINAIKELEITNHALDVRYKKNFYLLQNLQYEYENLKDYVNSYKLVKEKLLKEKNEIEVKYNNTLLKNSELLKNNQDNFFEIKKLKKENFEEKEKFEKYKNKIKNDYDSFDKNYKNLLKEKNQIVNSLNEFKNFCKFINYNKESIESIN